MQRRLSPDSRHVRVGFMLEQVYHNVHAAHEGSHVKWSQSRFCSGLDTWENEIRLTEEQNT